MNFDNAFNENKFNTIKASSSTAMHQLKKLIKPLFFIKKSKKKGSYRHNPQPTYFEEIDDNAANELLENQIFEEIDRCDDLAAVSAYTGGQLDIIPIFRGQRYIPVHFARTDAGTFFWTSLVGADSDIDSNGDRHPITKFQTPELQVPCDRWAQA